jgi:copper chaperone
MGSAKLVPNCIFRRTPLRLHVDNMSCQHCVRSVTKALQQLDPAAEVRVDLAQHQVELQGQIAAEAAIAALVAEGYPARLLL